MTTFLSVVAQGLHARAEKKVSFDLSWKVDSALSAGPVAAVVRHGNSSTRHPAGQWKKNARADRRPGRPA
jgi:hypothetical protein